MPGTLQEVCRKSSGSRIHEAERRNLQGRLEKCSLKLLRACERALRQTAVHDVHVKRGSIEGKRCDVNARLGNRREPHRNAGERSCDLLGHALKECFDFRKSEVRSITREA